MDPVTKFFWLDDSALTKLLDLQQQLPHSAHKLRFNTEYLSLAFVAYTKVAALLMFLNW